jgi:hypothetical protein
MTGSMALLVGFDAGVGEPTDRQTAVATAHTLTKVHSRQAVSALLS